MEKDKIGKVTHFFSKIGVAVVELDKKLSVGDRISLEGGNRIVEQTVESIQMDKKNVESADAGKAIGLKVDGRVKPNYTVYRL